MQRKLLKSRWFKGVALAGVLAMGAAACGSSSPTSSSSTTSGGGSSSMKTGPGVDTATKTITLGDITALSGPAAVIGKPLDAGLKAFYQYTNDNGGIDGWKVNLTTLDDAYDPQKHVQDYNQLANSVAFLATSFGSPTTSAIEAPATAANMLVATVAQDSAFVNHSINLVVDSPYAVDTANSLYYLTQTLGKKNAKVAIFYQNDAYGQDGLKGFDAAKSAYGFTDAGHATYNVTDTSFTSQATQLKNSGAQYVVVTAIPTAAAALIGTAAALGYHPQWILQGPAWSEYLMTSTGTPSGTPTPVENALVGAWVMNDLGPWGDTSVPGMAQFLNILKKYNPSQSPDYYYMYGYCQAEVQVAILKKAIENKDLTRAGIVSAKQSLGTFSFGGLSPDATYTSANGPATRQTAMFEVDRTSPAFLKKVTAVFESDVAKNMTFAS